MLFFLYLRRALEFFRGPQSKEMIDMELNEILAKRKEKLEAQSLESAARGGSSPSGSSLVSCCYTLKRLHSTSFYKPFFCLGTLYGLTQFNGIPTLVNYLTNIFQDSGSGMDPKLGPIFVGLARVATALLSSFVMLKVRKRHTFILSTVCLG